MLCNHCGVEINELKYTNAVWNSLKLNSPARVGYLLDEVQNFNNIDDFKYSKLDIIDIISQEFSSKVEVPLEASYKAVEHRLICDTWIGWDRELRALEWLKTHYPKYTYMHAIKELDWKYGIDFMCYYDNQLMGCIQVKPASWLGESVYLSNAKASLQKKHDKLYEDLFVKCLILIDADGFMLIKNPSHVNM